MTISASSAVAASQALTRLARDDRGRLLSALVARLKDFQLAEDALQDAMVSAVVHWGRNGLPSSPSGWLLQVAFRKAIDRIRRQATAGRSGQDLELFASLADEEVSDIPDERLRLIFTCCHPAIEPKSQVALTLRTLGGLSTQQIAAAFLDKHAAMGQRLSRAKAKIAAAGIPFSVPDQDQWAERLEAVLTVIYLIFNAGYSAGPQSGIDLAEEALFLCRLLNSLTPEEAEAEGCLALLMLSHARRHARKGPSGAAVPLALQDRSLWVRAEIAEGVLLVERALRRRQVGPFQIKAAIAACHSDGETSDWPQIARLYDELLVFEPTAVVRLNRAVAVAEAGDLAGGLAAVLDLETELSAYQPFHAACAELLKRSGCHQDAVRSYERAIAMAASEEDRLFLSSSLELLLLQQSA